jgi:hypothetical protein
MSLSLLLFAVAALGTLGLGFQAFRLTSSSRVRLLTCLGTIALTFAAFGLRKPGGSQAAAQIAFVVAMLFCGHAAGVFWQSRRNAELRAPSNMLFAVGGLSLVAAITAFFS